jgi:predicted pyridoxine 5'-phosphate oxidase superfamily flavin-nucleotide-binding protein
VEKAILRVEIKDRVQPHVAALVPLIALIAASTMAESGTEKEGIVQ